MNSPYKVENNSTLNLSSTQPRLLVTAEINYANVLNHNVEEEGAIIEHSGTLKTMQMDDNEGANVIVMKDMSHTILEPGHTSCYEIRQMDWEYIYDVEYWVECVFLCIIAASGLLGNACSVFILLKNNMRNSFNLLLVALACMDSCYLIGAILEAFRYSGLASDVHLQLFPYFLYPGISIAVTCSIFMTVAMALERYIAIHCPVTHRETNNNHAACKRRLLQYVGPVIIFSITMLTNY